MFLSNVTGYSCFSLSLWYISSSDSEALLSVSSITPGSGIPHVLQDHVPLLSVSYPSVLSSSADDDADDEDDDDAGDDRRRN